eukprot:scaffold189_cov249-Pinguiococcus_pyrenoidosus.AAC.4
MSTKLISFCPESGAAGALFFQRHGATAPRPHSHSRGATASCKINTTTKRGKRRIAGEGSRLGRTGAGRERRPGVSTAGAARSLEREGRLGSSCGSLGPSATAATAAPP